MLQIKMFDSHRHFANQSYLRIADKTATYDNIRKIIQFLPEHYSLGCA